jgi:hypothetical protein
MPWLGILGFLLIAGFLLFKLWLDSVRERPVYERPSFLIHSRFWSVYPIASWLLFLTGWILAAWSFPQSAMALGMALALAWGWKRWVRGKSHRRRMIRQAFEREKVRDPSATDSQVLQRILYSLHPRWGEELIEQIAIDNPTPERVADMLTRIEQGALPSGFNPASMLRRR